MTTGKQVVDCARSYLGTPFHHQGRLKGIGLDCVGLLIRVGHDLGLTEFDHTGYPRQPIEERLYERFREELDEINSWEALPGDIVLFRILKHPQHLAILGDYHGGGLSLIHAYSPVGKVTEAHFSASWGSRAFAYFRYKGVTHVN